MEFNEFLKYFKTKPFIDSRIFSDLGDSKQLILNQVNKWQKKELIFSLKRGLYLFSDVYKEYPDLNLVANTLVQPSYLSMEYALGYYNLIPEAVFTYTSVTSKKTKQYRNKLGFFTYSHITEKRFFGYRKEAKGFFIAEPEKALLDYIYFKTNITEIGKIYFQENLRLQNIENISLSKIENYGKKFNSSKIFKAIKELKKEWKKL
ncbi:MAG: hypothetical protein KKA19_08405 [Candidatus Margulisbacteria bacterium]|nr:hypothetical protein [Candidatus Margulisiibacteriota bacterium]